MQYADAAPEGKGTSFLVRRFDDERARAVWGFDEVAGRFDGSEAVPVHGIIAVRDNARCINTVELVVLILGP